MPAETVSILQIVPDAPIIARRVLTTPELAAQQTPEMRAGLWDIAMWDFARRKAEACHA